MDACCGISPRGARITARRAVPGDEGGDGEWRGSIRFAREALARVARGCRLTATFSQRSARDACDDEQSLAAADGTGAREDASRDDDKRRREREFEEDVCDEARVDDERDNASWDGRSDAFDNSERWGEYSDEDERWDDEAEAEEERFCAIDERALPPQLSRGKRRSFRGVNTRFCVFFFF